MSDEINWNGPRVRSILDTNNILGQWIVERPLDRGFHTSVLTAQQAALDTINFLFNHKDRSQLMMGRAKNSAVVAPIGRAAVL